LICGSSGPDVVVAATLMRSPALAVKTYASFSAPLATLADIVDPMAMDAASPGALSRCRCRL
jgi:hypothetical protein